MGYSDWSSAAYSARQNHRKKSNKTAFTYDKKVRKTGIKKVHEDMNPYRATRESRDSDKHPGSLAIGVVFDVTGSMGSVPRVLQTKLGALMRILVQRGYVAHPQVLFGAIGDANSDQVPLQIGQFESGLEMDDDLGKIFIEGGGGGQTHETYELATYFFARHTAIDCYEKRGKKGYLFTMGDEMPYAKIRKAQVLEHIGDQLERDISTTGIFAEVQERYEYFHIIPTSTGHGRSPHVQERWRKLLGERVLLLDDETAVCETIALTIGLCEGAIDDLYSGMDDLMQAGYAAHTTASASTALTQFAASHEPQAALATGFIR